MSVYHHVITDEMADIARSLAGMLAEPWYLAGGTALALRIGHRTSIDLDYFSSEDFDTQAMKATLANTFPSTEVTFETANTLWVRINDVRVSFITRHEQCIASPTDTEYGSLAALSDIAIMKLLALCSREEYKDYVDVAALAMETDPRVWPTWWQRVHPQQDATSWVVALGAIEEVTPVPLEMHGTYADLDVAATVTRAAREVTQVLEDESA